MKDLGSSNDTREQKILVTKDTPFRATVKRLLRFPIFLALCVDSLVLVVVVISLSPSIAYLQRTVKIQTASVAVVQRETQ